MASKLEGSGERSREEQTWSPVRGGESDAASLVETALKEMKRELEQAKLDKNERERYLKLKEEQIQKLTKRLEERETREGREEEIAQKDVRISELQTIIKENDRENEALRLQLKRVTLELFDTSDKTKNKQVTIEGQKAKISQQEETISLMGIKITEMTNKLLELTNEISELKEKLDMSQTKEKMDSPSSSSGKLKVFIREKRKKSSEPLPQRPPHSSLERTSSSLPDWEEEKLVLTRQVHAYSDQCDELKRKLQDAHDRCTQEVEKNERLNIEIQSMTHEQLISLQTGIEEREGKVKNLTAQLTTERSNNELLTMKVDDFRARMYEANRVLKEKNDILEKEISLLKAENTQLREEKKRIQKLIKSSTDNLPTLTHSDPYSYHTPSYEASNYKGNYSNNSKLQYQRGLSVDTIVEPALINVPHLGKEREKDDDKLVVPLEGLYYNKEKKKGDDMLMKLEENSKKESEEADRALRELEETRREMERDHINFTPGLLPIPHAPLSPRPLGPHSPSRYPSSPSLTNGHIKKEPSLETDYSPLNAAPVYSPPRIPKEAKSDDIPENPLLQNIDREIQEAAQWVRDQSRRPPTAEVEADSDEESTLPYDPNLICPKCGKRYHIGGIQLFKRHVTELCTVSSSS